MSAREEPAQRSAWVRVHCDDGSFGIGEASPMQGGLASLGIVKHNLAPALVGEDPLDHAVLQDRLLHSFVKLGPKGALTGALAAIDIALWDLKSKLLGGAWRTRLPFYASIGGNGERCVDEVLRAVERRSCGRKDPLRQRPHQARPRHCRRHCEGPRRAAAGRRRLAASLRRQ